MVSNRASSPLSNICLFDSFMLESVSRMKMVSPFTTCGISLYVRPSMDMRFRRPWGSTHCRTINSWEIPVVCRTIRLICCVRSLPPEEDKFEAYGPICCSYQSAYGRIRPFYCLHTTAMSSTFASAASSISMSSYTTPFRCVFATVTTVDIIYDAIVLSHISDIEP